MHKTFLLFYQAICYESLGHIAHNYSSNRIPLLEQARDAFILANESLPSVALQATTKGTTSVEHSPACATFDIAALYDTPTATSIYTPRSLQLTDADGQENCSSTPACEGQITRTRSIFDYNDCSPLNGFHAKGSPVDSPERMLLTPDQTGPFLQRHKNRLSRSLSSKHALAEELIPSPLFSRGPCSRKDSRSASPETISPINSHQLTQVVPCKPLPPLPSGKQLPGLPFNHNPYFIRKGKRFVVVPRRKTALSTLISKFEGGKSFSEETSPSKRGSFNRLVESSNQTLARTPVTERFDRISKIFARTQDEIPVYKDGTPGQPHHTNQGVNDMNQSPESGDEKAYSDTENIDPEALKTPFKMSPATIALPLKNTSEMQPVTPCPRPRIRFDVVPPCEDSPPSSYTLTQPPSPSCAPSSPSPHRSQPALFIPTALTSTAYTNHLIALRPLLQRHTQTVTSTILCTREIQQQHDLEKRARFAASYNSSSEISSSPSPSPSPGNSGQRSNTRSEKVRTKPLHSFWSLQVIEDHHSSLHTRQASKVRNADKTYIHTSTQRNIENENPRSDAMNDRIQRLKATGWNVKKERVGFKGVEYYRGIVAIVEGELSLALHGEKDT